MGRQLYIYVDGERRGPYEMAAVREMLEDEELDFRDYCQPVGSARRRRLSEFFEVVAEDEGSEDEDPGEEFEAADEEEDSPEPEGAVATGRVLYAGHPAILNYPLALVVAVTCGLGGYLLGPTSLGYFIGGSLVAIGAILYILIDRTTRQYLVTPRRVEVIWGLVVKSSNEARIRDIRTINVRRTGLRGFFGVGTVEFSSVGDAVDVAFANIFRPHRVKRLVRSLQDEEAG